MLNLRQYLILSDTAKFKDYINNYDISNCGTTWKGKDRNNERVYLNIRCGKNKSNWKLKSIQELGLLQYITLLTTHTNEIPKHIKYQSLREHFKSRIIITDKGLEAINIYRSMLINRITLLIAIIMPLIVLYLTIIHSGTK